jgi:methanogenic corrinoid protein MtbC1
MSQGSQSWRLVGDEPSPVDACKKSLLSVIELQIVPHLVRAHRDQLPSGSAAADPYIPPSADMVAEFAQLCHLEDEKACWEMVDRLMHDRRGAPEILLKLIAPAARYLGQLWNQDQLNFSQVTLGLLRMQNMTHHYSSLSRRSSHREGPKFRAMVAAAPGSQHLLGLTMVSEFFVNDGWDVHVEVATTEKNLLGAVRANWFDVLGLSVGLLQQLDTLPALVKALRSHSLNPRIGVLLGGVAFTQVGSAGECYGADAVCLDPLAAMRVARQLAMRSLGPDTGKS